LIVSVSARKDSFPELVARIEAEFAEMPGLSVTLPQAQRLWAIDYPTSIAVFRTLTDRGVVKRTPRGQYIRSAGFARRAAAA
jgi:hypothetical protein